MCCATRALGVRGAPGDGTGALVGSAAMARPQRKALMFAATATPLSVIASSMACAGIGSRPVW